MTTLSSRYHEWFVCAYASFHTAVGSRGRRAVGNGIRKEATATRQIVCGLLLLIPCVAGAAETPAANRWDIKLKQKGIADIQRRTYRELAALHNYEYRGGASGIMEASLPGGKHTLARLYEMKIDSLPFLAEALDDFSPTKVVTPPGNSANNRTFPETVVPPHVWKVNELVARIIQHVAGREFALGEWGHLASLSQINSHPDRIPELQKQIVEWYKNNKDRTLEERYLADLDSEPFGTRFGAEMWLGRHKSVKGVPLLVKRIDVVLAQPGTSLTQKELAEVSLALGEIGDPKGLPAVKKVYDHISFTLPHWHDSYVFQNLYTACHGVALLGHKKEALAELKRIYNEYGPNMDAVSKKECEECLRKAAKW